MYTTLYFIWNDDTYNKMRSMLNEKGLDKYVSDKTIYEDKKRFKTNNHFIAVFTGSVNILYEKWQDVWTALHDFIVEEYKDPNKPSDIADVVCVDYNNAIIPLISLVSIQNNGNVFCTPMLPFDTIDN